MPETGVGPAARFDGQRWVQTDPDGDLWVTPSLVDAGCGIAGYRESLSAPLLRAPQAIGRLLRESGVRSIRISASSWAEYWQFLAVLGVSGDDLRVVGGGPHLVVGEPDSDRQRWIRQPDDLTSAADLAAAEGVGWLPVQTTLPDFIRDCVRAAAKRGLRVALRGDPSCAAALRPGDVFSGLGNLARTEDRESPLSVLSAWSEPDRVATMAGSAARLLEAGVAITTELLTLHRSVFVRDALNAPFLEENEPILPHVRWLLQMRRGAGYFGGRGSLAEHTGLREPSRPQARTAHAGWERILATAAGLFDLGVGLWPASSSPQLTQLPGFALKEELALLQSAGVDTQALLRRATSYDLCAGLDHGLARDRPSALLATTTPPQSARFFTSLRPLTCGATSDVPGQLVRPSA